MAAITPEQIAEMKADVERAHTEVGEVCRRTGPGRWRMSIPAQPDRDSDLVISRALTHADALVAEVERFHACLDAITAAAEAMEARADRSVFGDGYERGQVNGQRIAVQAIRNAFAAAAEPGEVTV